VTGNVHALETSHSTVVFHDIAQNRPSESARKSGPNHFSARVQLRAETSYAAPVVATQLTLGVLAADRRRSARG